MNYTDETYAYIKAHPGCRTTEISNALNVIIKIEYNQKTKLGKFLANFPFGFGDEVWIPSIFGALDQLEAEGLIRWEIIDKRRKFYPTGKSRKSSLKNNSFNLKLQHV